MYLIIDLDCRETIDRGLDCLILNKEAKIESIINLGFAQQYIQIDGQQIIKKSRKQASTKTIDSLQQSKKQVQFILSIFKQEAIIEEDDRQGLQQKDTIPFIGLIRGKFKSKQSTYIGTGIVISQNLVLTAAHNVCSINSKKYKKFKEEMQSQLLKSAFIQTMDSSLKHTGSTLYDHVEYADWIQFYPGLNGEIKGLFSIQDTIVKRNSPQNCYRIQSYKVHPSYLSDFHYKRYDLCVMQLEKPIELRQKIKILENYRNLNTQISVYGYPKDRCIKDEGNKIKVQQIGAKGRFKLDQEAGFINYKLATEIGQSGSPIFINTLNNGKSQYFCIGIHSGANKDETKNVGIHLNQEKMQFIVDAEENLTGKLSKIKTVKFPQLPENYKIVLPQKSLKQKSLEQYEEQLQKAQSNGGNLPKLFIYYYKQAALICLSNQNYKKAIIYYQKFIKAIEDLPHQIINEDDQDEYEIALINLAKGYCEQGQYEVSLLTYDKAEKKCKEFSNLSIEKQSTILNNKGAVMVSLGKYEEAMQNFKTSYLLRKNKFGEENLMTYNAFENYTSMKFKLNNNLDQCLKDYQKVFKFKQKKFGLGSPQSLKSKSNIASILFELKRYRQSLEAFYFCLEMFKKIEQQNKRSYYNQCLKLLTICMRELCKSQCGLQDLKYGFHMCQQYGLSEISKQVETEWQKRKNISHE